MHVWRIPDSRDSSGPHGRSAAVSAATRSDVGGFDITGLYTASGYAPFLGQAAMLIWFLVASVPLIVKRPAPAPLPIEATANA